MLFSERLKIERHNTQFTYRSTLKLSNVQESDANDYFCVGNIKNTSNDEALYPLSDRGNYKLVIYSTIFLFKNIPTLNKFKKKFIVYHFFLKVVIFKCLNLYYISRNVYFSREHKGLLL